MIVLKWTSLKSEASAPGLNLGAVPVPYSLLQEADFCSPMCSALHADLLFPAICCLIPLGLDYTGKDRLLHVCEVFLEIFGGRTAAKTVVPRNGFGTLCCAVFLFQDFCGLARPEL